MWLQFQKSIEVVKVLYLLNIFEYIFVHKIIAQIGKNLFFFVYIAQNNTKMDTQFQVRIWHKVDKSGQKFKISPSWK